MKKRLLTLLLCCLFGVALNAQNIQAKGNVINQDGKPLEGVSVIIKGMQKGTATNSKGEFTIAIAAKGATLIFSNVGFTNKEVFCSSTTPLKVTLFSVAAELDDVVIIGYGSQKKKDLVGAVSRVSMSDLTKAPVRSFDEALAGRVAGVQVSSSDGQPGSGITIVVRGNNSVTQANSPLYVVDGFPLEDNNNNTINPNDIESIEVLKDASATAIYGARGANGVVMITTKKGKEGLPQLSFDASYGLQNANRKIPMMNAYDYVKYMFEMEAIRPTTGAYPGPSAMYLKNGMTLDDYKKSSTTDWQGLVLQQAPMANYNMSLIGGNTQTKYAISGSVFDQEGVLINSGYKRYQGRIVLDQQVNNKLKVGINTNYSYLLQSGMSPFQNNTSSSNNVMVAIWGARPVTTVNGGILDLLQDPEFDHSFDYRINPVINLQNMVRLNSTKNLIANAYAEYAILPSLKLRVTGGITDNASRSESFNNSRTEYGYNGPGNQNGVNGSLGIGNSVTWLNENTLTWSKITKNQSLVVLGGFTSQKNQSDAHSLRAIFLPHEDLGVSGLNEGTLQPIVVTSSNWSMASFLARVNYSYQSRYILTASFRADGSSKFPEKNHWGYFPSAGATWRFSDEKWLQNSRILSNGKLRVSYGATGNNRSPDFGYLSIFGQPNASSYIFNGAYVAGTVPTSLGNSELKWETTKASNIGLDLGVLKNRIELTVDLYRKVTKDLLLSSQLPTSTGFATAFKNVGSMQNQGLEVTLSTINVRNRNFLWNSSFNISFNQGKILALADNQESLTRGVPWDYNIGSIPAYISKVGMPLGMMYGLIYDGVFHYSDFNRTASGGYILKDGIAGNGNNRNAIRPGDAKFRDINGDGKIDQNDYTIIGRGQPIHFGGFSNNFTYKNFDLNIFMQWSYGNNILNNNLALYNGGNNRTANQYASYNDRWSSTNQNSQNPGTLGYLNTFSGYRSNLVEDGSYLRLKTVSLGYNFSKKLMDRLKIKSLRIYLSGQNLVTLTKYSGLDPEVSAIPSALTPGFDFSVYPRARTFTVGAKVVF